jgi:hypothetical protein
MSQEIDRFGTTWVSNGDPQTFREMGCVGIGRVSNYNVDCFFWTSGFLQLILMTVSFF